MRGLVAARHTGRGIGGVDPIPDLAPGGRGSQVATRSCRPQHVRGQTFALDFTRRRSRTEARGPTPPLTPRPPAATSVPARTAPVPSCRTTLGRPPRLTGSRHVSGRPTAAATERSRRRSRCAWRATGPSIAAVPVGSRPTSPRPVPIAAPCPARTCSGRAGVGRGAVAARWWIE